MLYVWIIAAAVAVIATLNGVLMPPVYATNGWWLVFATVLSTVAVIAADGIVALVVNHLPKKWFNHKSKFFTVGAKEKKFYEKLKIRKLKDRIPELGALGGFSKSEISDPYNNEYVERFLTENACGEIVHIASLFFGFVIFTIFPKYILTVGLPVALVNVALNIPSIFILRYNAHKLEVLFKANVKREQRAKKKQEEILAEAAVTE